MSIPLIRKDAA